LRPVCRKKIPVCAHTDHLPKNKRRDEREFCTKQQRTLNSFKEFECVTFSGKRKKGGNDNKKMITLNDNINDNTHPVQGKMITQK
jgi:hypothetical protein